MPEPASPLAEAAAFLKETLVSVEDVIDARWRRMKRRMGWDGVPRIVPYTGYANETRAWFHGRVLTNPPPAPPQEDDGWWTNLAAMWQRIESDEVPGAEVAVDFAGRRHVVTTDKEGYFHLEAERHGGVGPAPPLWTAAAMHLVGREGGSLVTAKLMTPAPDARFGVISDVDDTVLHTDVVNLTAMARHTFFHNARTRTPLPGVAGLYRSLQDAGGPQRNPIWYVSSSPWNLHDLLEDFLELNGIPDGPLLLRDLGLGRDSHLVGGHGHKLEKSLRIMDAFPKLPFVLIGDSGQEDATLYAEAAEQRPGRLELILIRDVNPDLADHRDDAVGAAVERARTAGAPMHLIADSDQGARLCREAGLL